METRSFFSWSPSIASCAPLALASAGHGKPVARRCTGKVTARTCEFPLLHPHFEWSLMQSENGLRIRSRWLLLEWVDCFLAFHRVGASLL